MVTHGVAPILESTDYSGILLWLAEYISLCQARWNTRPDQNYFHSLYQVQLKRNLQFTSKGSTAWPTECSLFDSFPFVLLARFGNRLSRSVQHWQLNICDHSLNWPLKLVHIITCQWNISLVSFFSKTFFFHFNIVTEHLENGMKY